ncbi:hypothetical protein N7493_002137 [Penicillium malachiteum]|uniref:Uncharacterized protein n=1 Tax=Penicillium malachiteum TaxID=1324776 RepID=A0AAD6HRA7_9EURO|nr:hypothetical protein N7493_002137 [Penicillium malachiteum]
MSTEAEEKELREHPGDFTRLPDPFTTAVGHFWGIYHTRDYMRARFALAEAIGRIHNVEATEAQLEHLMNMLRLCRSDTMGLRSLVPALMLRLNKDQERYDFIKWWAMDRDDYDWEDTDLPYLDIKGADPFESVDQHVKDFVVLSHTVSLTLLKIKLLLDLMKIRDSTSTVGPKNTIPQSPLVCENRMIMGGEDQDRLTYIERLKGQIDQLYEKTDSANSYFWPHLLNPGHHLNDKSSAYSMGSMEEMTLALQWTYAAWTETPGAIDFIKAKRAGSI